MRVIMCALATTLCLATLSWTPARADNCLQQFHCQLYGPCPFPCLERLMGALQSPQVPPAAPPAEGRELADASKAPEATARTTPAKPEHRTKPKSERLAIVRVVAAPGVASLAELAGKPVSFGPEGDASQIVGRRMFAKLGVKVVETPLAFDNAIDGVGTGDLAAVVVMHDRDVAKLKAMSSAKLALLAVPAGAEPPADMMATTLSAASAGTLAHGRTLRAFAIAVAEMPRLTRHMASATP